MARASNGKSAPSEGLVFVGEEERTRLRELREKKELTQGDLARKLRHRVSAPTISNFETMRHPRVERTLYADIKWALERDEPVEEEDEMFRDIVSGLTGMEAQLMQHVRALVGSLKKPR
jgi:transcriptional regulator with XRE-family HTH domain